MLEVGSLRGRAVRIYVPEPLLIFWGFFCLRSESNRNVAIRVVTLKLRVVGQVKCNGDISAVGPGSLWQIVDELLLFTLQFLAGVRDSSGEPNIYFARYI
jgi:hypothetical protein